MSCAATVTDPDIQLVGTHHVADPDIRLGEGAYHMADPDIQLGGAHHVVHPDTQLAGSNLIYFPVSHAYFFAQGGKVYSQTGWGAMVGFAPCIRHCAAIKECHRSLRIGLNHSSMPYFLVYGEKQTR